MFCFLLFLFGVCIFGDGFDFVKKCGYSVNFVIVVVFVWIGSWIMKFCWFVFVSVNVCCLVVWGVLMLRMRIMLVGLVRFVWFE